jgi:exosortase/archaeosortase family protein
MLFGSQKMKFLAGLLLLLAGLEIAVTLTYLARWVGIVLMLFGIGILVLTARKEPEKEIAEEEPEKPPEEKRTLAEALISFLTIKGRIRGMLPILGVLLVLFVYGYNLVIYGTLEIGVNDTITILLGLTLILYNYIPDKFGKERDFVFMFFIFLFFILVVPIQLYSLSQGPLKENTNSPFIYHLLARPTSDMLNFIGIPSSVHTVPPNQWVNNVFLENEGVYIVYKNLGDSQQPSYSTVGVFLSCTGLYSVSIFISGFIAFILIEYRQLDIRVASLLTLGIFTSWFANILRMTIIVAVGSHYGADALQWTHANLGIFIFMVWVGIFWALMFKLLMPKDKNKEGKEDEPGEVEGDQEGGQLEEEEIYGGEEPKEEMMEEPKDESPPDVSGEPSLLDSDSHENLLDTDNN